MMEKWMDWKLNFFGFLALSPFCRSFFLCVSYSLSLSLSLLCLQLFLDVKEFGKQLQKLGIAVGQESTPEYAHLWQTVAPEGKKDAIDLLGTN